MEISNHSLPQITPEVLNKLTRDESLPLSVKLLKDLKELHDRLNQNPKNSSRPSSSMAAWEKNNDANKNETIEDSIVDIKSESEPKSEKIINDKKENEEVSPNGKRN